MLRILKRTIVLFSVFTISAWSLTSMEIRTRLASQPGFASDSLEVSSRITLEMPGVKQVMKTYSVSKGPGKYLTEFENSLMHQRTIYSGDKIKVMDIQAGTSQVTSSASAVVDSLSKVGASATSPSPMDTGSWSEPVFDGGNLYKLVAGSSELYWDNLVGRFVGMRIVAADGVVELSWEYTTTTPRRPLRSTTVITRNGVRSSTTVEYLVWQSSAKFPDRFFVF